jgi:cyclase
MVKRASAKCLVPLTIGGGISHINHIKELMHCGADKISLNQAAIVNPRLITEASHVFGNQCIVVSIDSKIENNRYKVYDYINKNTLSFSPDFFAKQAQELGAGEILINSVDRDGTYKGFDIDLINSVCDAVTIPVICSGGAKNANDFIEVLTKTRTSAACAANFFHFTEHSVNITKANISKKTDVRLETFAKYDESRFNEELRLNKKEDKTLEEMLFIKIEKEII